MLNCVNLYNCFDSLSHIDYPCRYCSFDNKEIIVSNFKEILSEIFTILINKNKVLELNSSRLHIKSAEKALTEIYKLYKDLGGRYVTIGSDAHNYKNISKNFDIALNFIDYIGLQGVYFNKRKVEYF